MKFRYGLSQYSIHKTLSFDEWLMRPATYPPIVESFARATRLI